MIKHILVPVDFSEASLESFDHAVDLAKRYEAQILLMHVVEPIYYAVPVAEVLAEQKAFARSELERLAARLAARGVACHTLLCVGIPHVEIVNAARGDAADMIVMTTHGRTGFSHLMMGSVAEKVVRTAECPVLTVHCANFKEAGARDRPASAA